MHTNVGNNMQDWPFSSSKQNLITASLPMIWPSVVVSDWYGLSCIINTTDGERFTRLQFSISDRRLNKPAHYVGKSAHSNHSIGQQLRTVSHIGQFRVNKDMTIKIAETLLPLRIWGLRPKYEVPRIACHTISIRKTLRWPINPNLKREREKQQITPANHLIREKTKDRQDERAHASQNERK